MKTLARKQSVCLAPALFILTLFSSVVFADFGTISGMEPGDSARWMSGGGVTTLKFNPSLMDAFGMEISGSEAAPSGVLEGNHRFEVSPSSTLSTWAPHAAFDGFIGGELAHIGELDLQYPGGNISLQNFSIVPSGAYVLDVVTQSGETVFHLNYIHVMYHPDDATMDMLNMDLRISESLAGRLGQPQAADMVIGQGFTQTTLIIPSDAIIRGNEICTSPNWHDGVKFETDVALFLIDSVQETAREPGGRVAITPSAKLRNVGTADVPWYQKLTTQPGDEYPEPYSLDQHPFLVWAVYREVDGVLRQIGISEVKHAFYSTNTACSCGGGHVLWAAGSTTSNTGCEDLYGVGNNNNPLHLGLREEVPSFTGAWEQCGSMFAPDETAPGPCAKDLENTGATSDDFERRLWVNESDLEIEGASYSAEAWYVIREDINIFNSMARVTITPEFGGSVWGFSPGPTKPGPALDDWVSSGTNDADQAHAQVSTVEGHLSVAVKVTDLGEGVYRYVYALMNYDFDSQFKSFSLELPTGVNVDNITFSDSDEDATNDWVGSTGIDKLMWDAPAEQGLDWGRMATLTFEADTEPEAGLVTVQSKDSPLIIPVEVLVMGNTDRIFNGGFEGE